MAKDTPFKPPPRLVRVAAYGPERGLTSDLMLAHLRALGVPLARVGPRGIFHFDAVHLPLIEASLQPEKAA